MFLEHSREYPLMIDHMTDVMRRLPSGLRMVDIGAGTGSPIHALLQQSGITIDGYLGIESNPDHVLALRSLLKRLPLGDCKIMSVAFTPGTVLPGTFDLALFSHSLYGMADPVACFLHGAACLKPDGVAVAYLQGPYGDYALYQLFNPFFDRATPSLENGMSSHELVMGLRDRGVQPSVCYLPATIDMTGLFEPECHQQLSEFISFCLLVEFESVPTPLRGDVLQYLRAACIEQAGKLLWHVPTAAVMISARALA